MKYVIQYNYPNVHTYVMAQVSGSDVVVSPKLSDAYTFNTMALAKEYRQTSYWFNNNNTLIIPVSEQELFKAKLADV